MTHTIKVCTFNLRVHAQVDGENAFPFRRDRILDVIKSEDPDVIGFQEARDEAREWLRDVLGDYLVLGCGRDSDYRGEGTPVAVRRRMFEVAECRQFWLSPTPEVAGSRFPTDQSPCPRIAVALRLRHREAGQTLSFVNTHLDHMGEAARAQGAEVIREYLGGVSDPYILVGDMNATPESEVIRSMRDYRHCGRPTVDMTRDIPVTFHGWGKYGRTDRDEKPDVTEGIHIDYILTDFGADPGEGYAKICPPENGIFVSDHHPVFARIKIGEK